MKNYYIEYTLYYNSPEFDESESDIIEAKSKKKAIIGLKEKTKIDGYDRIVIDTIYQTTSDARSG